MSNRTGARRARDLRQTPPRVSPVRLARAAATRTAVQVPAIIYPEELPVSARREDIAAAIAAHQVVVVAGETGSGKTTQLPKILIELGRGRAGQIGHTQPRRIAARSVAERIAHELGVSLGSVIGYQVRFTDQSSDETLVKVMTDGILLAQIQRDPDLLAYDTIVIDEAHERSLNIDFLLGYLARLLPRRPDLKVIITSATIDSERFAEHFSPSHLADLGGAPPDVVAVLPKAAPVIEVTGRTYPVEIRYRPLTASPRHSAVDGAESQNDAGGKYSLRNDGFGRVEEVDLPTGIVEACDELMREGHGDILVFLSGEREIHDTADALEGHLGERTRDARRPDYVEILPLYSRLSAAEQHRVFSAHPGRRIVLSTNVAETSLTVPGIRYVVDTGLARISRFSKATKVQRLPIEAISQASANQRSGRCGRVADGVAIRLYAESDFDARPEYTEPEILRTSLASVPLQMIAVGVVDSPDEVARFPFVDPPDVRAVRDGVILLRELGALETVHATNKRHSAGTPPSSAQNDEEKTSTTTTTRLTVVGRKLARLPMDPRLARMILEGAKLGAAHAVSIIAAALSVQDVRERPAEFRERADQLHSRFVDPTSDFLSYLNLWEYLRAEQKARSGSAFRRMCKAEHLNFLRVREWQDVVAQLREMSRELDIDLARRGQTAELVTPPHPSHSARSEERAQSQNLDSKGHPASLGPATPLRSAQDNGDGNPVAGQFRRRWDDDIIHRALLAGLLSQIGMQETGQVKASSVAHLSGEARARALRQQAKRARNEYLGARGARFAIFPGSPLSKKPPAWVMAGELVETSRLWGRDVARIQPEWVEALAGELAKRTYSNPHWSTKQGAAMAREKVLLYGVPVVADRPVLYAKVDAEAAREMFIRHALVLGEWTTHHRFYAENLALLAEAEQVEARTRQRGLVASEDDLFAFYDERLPESIVSRAHFDKWWGKARRNTPDLLTFRLADLVDAEATAADEAGFPPTWTQGDVTLPLTYQFSPGEAADGVTVHIPLAVLPRLMPSGFDWMVPGMLDELCVATIKSLPKAVRVQLVPAPDVGAEVATWLRAHTPAWADMARAGDMAEPFHASFTRAVRALREVIIPDAAWDEARAERLPAHLRITFRVDTSPSYQLTNAKQAAPHHHSAGAQTTTPRHSTDANQTTTPRHSAGAQQSAESTIDESKDLLALQRRLAAKAEDAVRAAVKGAVGVALDEARAAAKPPPISPRHSARAERVAEPSVDGSRPGLGSATAFANAHSAQNDVGVAEQFNLTTWPSALPGGEIPESVSTDVGGGTVVRGYPALVVEAGAKVALRILATPADRDLAHPLGVRRLLLAENRLADARITSRWSGQQALTLASSPYRNTSALVEALQLAAVTALTTPDALPSSPPGSANPARPVADHAAQSLDAATVCDASAYDTAKAYVRQHLEDETYRTAGHVVAALAAYRTLEGEIRATTSLALLNVLQDIREHAASLIYDGFITDTPPQRLPHLVRYLRAASHRLEKAQTNPHRDAELAWRIHDVEQAYNASRAAYATGRPDPTRAAALVEVRWQLEELRVSLFAQQLGTDGPISEKRIRKALLG